MPSKLLKLNIQTFSVALQTAYVKAHRLNEFQAVASVLRSEMPH